jgi:hypothetical protein
MYACMHACMYVFMYIDGDWWDGGGMRFRVFGERKRGQVCSARYASSVSVRSCIYLSVSHLCVSAGLMYVCMCVTYASRLRSYIPT